MDRAVCLVLACPVAIQLAQKTEHRMSTHHRSLSLDRWRLSARPLVGLLALAALVAGAGCGGGDALGGDDKGGGGASLAELKRQLPAAGDLGLEPQREYDWDDPTDVLVQGLVIPEATTPAELGAAIEGAGFQGAVGSALAASSQESNVRIVAAEFDSEDGALEARDLLHEQDLKQPCFAACSVSPSEYEVGEIPDSAAVHHAPLRGELPPGMNPVEAYHAEFVIGPRLYVLQRDGPPSPTFGAEFDKVLRTVYEAASGK
jgi:hypothetical protein